MPPAMSSTSSPSTVWRGQALPKGPRTPTTSPFFIPHRARVTAPTRRMVCTSPPSGAPLTEMGASPTPKT